MREILLGLGANRPGKWGDPVSTLRQLSTRLDAIGVHPVAWSSLYATSPVGGPAQPDYLNAVVKVVTDLPPGSLLRRLKQLEVEAGRRVRGRWASRPLDIDILAHGPQLHGWRRRPTAPIRRQLHFPLLATALVVPHPRLHERAFVLRPLLDVAPHWRHPVLQLPARRLLAAQSAQHGRVRRTGLSWSNHPPPPQSRS